ncbi:MAG TPA: hypothetical protein DD490_02505 [Acidobacteria bacterium]|nr:hypothetical protein [Acidobacteriota bacterium]
MAFVKVEPDSFQMGDGASPDSRPVHRVSITRPFCIGAYEVTREQWAKVFKGSGPSEEERYRPEAGVKFADAEGFVRLVQESDPAGPAVRLPTEAEWEYVARGKATSKRSLPGTGNCGGDDRYDDLTWVGQFPPNYWGVYDMYGNVSEWVSDWYGGYPFEELPDPQGPPRGELRIRRGGSWKSSERFCNSTGRSKVDPANFSEETGFRIVREIR